MMNTHKNLRNPFWVAKKLDSSVMHYGQIQDGSQVVSKMPIHTFHKKDNMISFIHQNGGEYVNEEIL
jgi:hypothetical protein